MKYQSGVLYEVHLEEKKSISQAKKSVRENTSIPVLYMDEMEMIRNKDRILWQKCHASSFMVNRKETKKPKSCEEIIVDEEILNTGDGQRHRRKNDCP